jgi:hypothetical protein
MWYSMRPSLYVMPIAHKDVVDSLPADSYLPDSLRSRGGRRVFFTCENVGKSPGTINYVRIAVVSRNIVIETGYSAGGEVWPVNKKTTDYVDLIGGKQDTVLFDIEYNYTWDGSKERGETFVYRKSYITFWLNQGWSFRTITPAQFDGLYGEVPDSLRVPISTGVSFSMD